MDSLAAVEFRSRLSERLGSAELSETVIFDFPTARELATHIEATVEPPPALVRDEGSSALQPPAAATALGSIDPQMLLTQLQGLLTGAAKAGLPAAAVSCVPRLDPSLVVRSVAGELLGGNVDSDTPLMEAGLDSLAAVELRSRLAERLSLELPETLVFDFPTTREIEQHVAEELPQLTDGGDKPEPRLVASAEALLVSSLPAPAAITSAASVAASADHPGTASRIVLSSMSANLPGGVTTPRHAHDALSTGADLLDEVPTQRWSGNNFLPSDDERFRSRLRFGGFLADADRFDSRFFRVSAAETHAADPQHRRARALTRLTSRLPHAPPDVHNSAFADTRCAPPLLVQTSP